jgi:hypothetical protein
MIDNHYSKLKANAMRPIMEKALGHKLTPKRNLDRFAIKTVITKIWNETTTGKEFLDTVRKAGYMVATGTGNRPFMIADALRTYELVRQIDGARTKDVRARLKGETLVTDKQALELMRKESNNSGKREKQKMSLTPDNSEIAKNFADNRGDAVVVGASEEQAQKFDAAFETFQSEAGQIVDDVENEDKGGSKIQVAVHFSETKEDSLTTDTEREAKKQRDLQKIIDIQTKIHERNSQRKRYRHR